MKHLHTFTIVIGLLLSINLWAEERYPLPEFELIVVENLPETMSLDMSLSQIEKAKESSRVGELKKRLQKTLFTNIAPLLASKDFSASFNLLQIPQLLPLAQIIKDLELQTGDPNTSADFIVIIAPRIPQDAKNSGYNPYAPLYPPAKAPVFTDYSQNPSPFGNYEFLINRRMLQGAEYLFEKKYLQGSVTTGFFAGAIISIHAQGNNSSAKAKIAIGLPTDQALPFEQENEQIKLTQIFFPRAPYNGYITKMDYPLVMVSLEHSVSSPNPSLLKLDFGTLGPIMKNEWNIGNSPSDSVVSQWFSWLNPYNVPHFRGEIRSIVQKEMLGWFSGATGWLNGFLGNHFDIQLNLHSVTLDLIKLEITDVKVTVDLPRKGGSELFPTFHVADPEEQFKNEGNKAIAEQKKKVQTLVDSGLLILSDPEAQKTFIETLNSLIGSKGVGQ